MKSKNKTHQIKHVNVQSHSYMAEALQNMARQIDTKTEEGKVTKRSLLDKASWHREQSIHEKTYIKS